MPPNLEKRPRTPTPPKDPRDQTKRMKKTPPWRKFRKVRKESDAGDVIELSSDDYVFETICKTERQAEISDGERVLQYFTNMISWLTGDSDSDMD